MIISGNLLEVGVKNDNGWGITLEEAQDVLSLLPGLPLKICKDRAHACDYKPKTEAGAIIGKILSAERVKNHIRISAEVTGEQEKHIRQGKYPKNWSIFTGYQNKDQNGYLTGAKPLSVSLVEYPAYRGSGYSILPDILHSAAAAYELSELDKYYLKMQEQAQQPKEDGKVRAIKTADKLYQALNHFNRKQPALSLTEALDKLEKGKYRGN